MTQPRGTNCDDAPPRRLTLDSAFAIDIRVFKREGKLKPNTGFIKEWYSHHSLAAMLGVAVRERDVVFLFHRLLGGYDHLPIGEQRVAVDHAPNPVSGSLTWFRCPKCERRVYKLYTVQLCFECQRCVGLRPAVDYLSARDRQSRRLEIINRKLSLPAWAPITAARCPAKMSWTAFEKLLAAKTALEAAGVREHQWLFDKVEANRKCRERDLEKRGPRLRNGVIYLD
jgi:hypothetical protein